MTDGKPCAGVGCGVPAGGAGFSVAVGRCVSVGEGNTVDLVIVLSVCEGGGVDAGVLRSSGVSDASDVGLSWSVDGDSGGVHRSSSTGVGVIGAGV